MKLPNRLLSTGAVCLCLSLQPFHSTSAEASAKPPLKPAAPKLSKAGTPKGRSSIHVVQPLPREELLAGLRLRWGKGPSTMTPPRPEVLEEKDMGDHIRRRISYRVDKDEKIVGWLLLPKTTNGSKLPLLMCPHPTHREGKDRVIGLFRTPPADKAEQAKRDARVYALELVRRGYICFAPDVLGFGERAPFPQNDSWSKNMEAASKQLAKRYPGWSFHAKAIWDLQRALDFLVALPEVDTNRIGTIGHSLGGWHSLWLAGNDERIKACVINGGGNLAFRKDLWENQQALKKYLSDSKAQEMHSTAALWLMAIAPRPTLYIKALNDLDAPDAPNFIDGFRHFTAFYREQMAGSKSTLPPFSIYVHNQGHSFNKDARELSFAWLDLQLKRISP